MVSKFKNIFIELIRNSLKIKHIIKIKGYFKFCLIPFLIIFIRNISYL